MSSLRQMAGCWRHERWRLDMVLCAPGLARLVNLEWPDLCNRHERVARGDEKGRVCQWKDSSWLTVARVFPVAGGRLMHHCLIKWPLVFRDQPLYDPVRTPDISVIIPVGGAARMSQCWAVLSALAGQTGVTVEAVVVEEGARSVFPTDVRHKVRHIFLHKNADKPYCKSRMFNAGAAVARGRYLLLHDADIILPSACLREVVQCLDVGYEGARPLRFLFCLNESASRCVQAKLNLEVIREVADIMQNFPGGSVAIRRDSYERIGGMDEQFTDWGGEDLEFLDRLNTRRLFRGAWMPGIHLWHEAASQKESGHRNRERLNQVLAVPTEKRIEQLLSR